MTGRRLPDSAGGEPMTGGPIARYRALIEAGAIHADPAQRMAIEKLQLLHTRLAGYDPAAPTRVGRGIFGWGRERIVEEPLTGLYIYGGVGRGKSMLMDLFFDHAPVARKRRVHFHGFMQEVHARIRAARASGAEDPIRPVAREVAQEATLLCFDELQVTDITDAMIVGRLFKKLFEKGVVIVTTSNRPPDDLYENGLNRQLFLPFVALMKARLDLLHLEAAADYRQGRADAGRVWFAPLGPVAEAAMDTAWGMATEGEAARPATISVHGRRLTIPLAAGEAARASFADLCEAPLGPGDFLAIAERFETLFLDRVPKLDRARNNEAKRFVTLIDALYEARVRLVCSAAAEPEQLYVEGEGAFEFARTASRLVEMRSAGWPG